MKAHHITQSRLLTNPVYFERNRSEHAVCMHHALQEMLGMSQEEAERVEIEVLQTPGAFAI